MTTQTGTCCVKPITPDERHVIKMLKNYVALRSYLDHLKEDQNPKDYRTILPYDLGECEDCLLEGPGSDMGLIEIMGWCTNDKCLDEGDSCDYCILPGK